MAERTSSVRIRDVDPSPWVIRFASLVSGRDDVLDIACGAGRHTRVFLARGHCVVAVDRDFSGVADLADHTRLEGVETDLEDETPFAGPSDPRLIGRPIQGFKGTD
jgi:SAM-dependent methyltransferase